MSFEQKAVELIAALLKAFPDRIYPIGAAAVAGNGGEESGLNPVEEVHPISNSLRGYGWFQDTGPRRTAFFNWCNDNHLSVNSDEGNIGYLIHELQTTYANVITAMAADPTLDGKTKIFMDLFERPNAKYANLDTRRKFAKRAYDAWVLSAHAVADPAPVTVPAAPPAARAGAAVGTVAGGAAAAVAHASGVTHNPIWLVAIVAAFIFGGFIIAQVVKGK